MPASSLSVEFSFYNGTVDRFEVYDPDQARILADQLNPVSNIFATHPIMLSEVYCLTAYKTDSIVKIDINGPAAPSWPYIGGASSVMEVTQEEFNEKAATDELSQQRLAAWNQPGTKQEGFTVLTLTTGASIIWRITMSSTKMVALDASQSARRLLTAGAIHGKKLDGGVTVVNTAHISRVSFFPGPPMVGPSVASVFRV